jgi:hypothetical protein
MYLLLCEYLCAAKQDQKKKKPLIHYSHFPALAQTEAALINPVEYIHADED